LKLLRLTRQIQATTHRPQEAGVDAARGAPEEAAVVVFPMP
jgi:hypothetical protein